jgi:hypothetical protein
MSDFRQLGTREHHSTPGESRGKPNTSLGLRRAERGTTLARPLHSRAGGGDEWSTGF